MSRDGYFFEGLNILISTFCVCADGFQDLSKLLTSLTFINFLFAPLKLPTNFENACWNPPQNSLHCDWSMFSSADLSLDAGYSYSTTVPRSFDVAMARDFAYCFLTYLSFHQELRFGSGRSIFLLFPEIFRRLAIQGKKCEIEYIASL